MVGQSQNRRGTTVRFRPDPEIFGENPRFQPARLFRMARSKAYLYRGVKIRWRCDAALLKPGAERSEEHTSELQSLMRISYAVFCLKKKTSIFSAAQTRMTATGVHSANHTSELH